MKENMSKCKITTIGMDFFEWHKGVKFVVELIPNDLKFERKNCFDVHSVTKFRKFVFLKKIALAILVENFTETPYNCYEFGKKNEKGNEKPQSCAKCDKKCGQNIKLISCVGPILNGIILVNPETLSSQ